MSTQQLSQFTKILVLGLISVLLWLICVATLRGFSNFLVTQAQYDMQHWVDKELTLDEWTSTQITLKRALQLEPYNPDFLEMMGNVYYWKSKVSTTTPQIIIARQQALDYFYKAIEQRAVSAFTWTNIIIMKGFLGQYDAQFVKALEQAMIFGPWEPFVHQTIAEIGLLAWDRLSEKGQSIVIMAVERGIISGQAKQMYGFIKKYQHEHNICIHSHQPAFFDFCQ
jgi:hypothetical protein